MIPAVQQLFRNEIAISFLTIFDSRPPVAVACGDEVCMTFDIRTVSMLQIIPVASSLIHLCNGHIGKLKRAK